MGAAAILKNIFDFRVFRNIIASPVFDFCSLHILRYVRTSEVKQTASGVIPLDFWLKLYPMM